MRLPFLENTCPLRALFAEELGLVLEVAPEDEMEVAAAYAAAGVPANRLGTTRADDVISMAVGDAEQPCIAGVGAFPYVSCACSAGILP